MGRSDLWKRHQTWFYVFKNAESTFDQVILETASKWTVQMRNNIGRSDDACDVLKLGIQSTMNEKWNSFSVELWPLDKLK